MIKPPRALSLTMRRIALFCIAYIAVTLALVVWSRRIFVDQAWDVMDGMAEVVAHESALLMNDAINAFSEHEIGPAELEDSIRRLTEQSATVQYASIIGGDGRLIASNDPAADDLDIKSLRDALERNHGSRIENLSAKSLKRGEFRVDIPFSRAGNTIALLRLDLTSKSVASLYRSAYLVQLVLSTVGLVSIGALGLLLHQEHERRRHRQARLLADVLSGVEEIDDVPDSSLAPALEAADRLYTSIAEGEMRAKETRRQLGQLDRALDVGIVVTNAAGDPQIVGDRARELLGIEASEAAHFEVETALQNLAPTVQRVLETGETSDVSTEVPRSDGSEWIDVRVLPFDTADERAVLLQLRNRSQVQALQQNLLDAARLRGLTRLYLGVAHDLRAPLNAIALNLANLKHSLTEADELASRQQDLRTFEIIEEEFHRLQRSVEALLQQTEPARDDEEEFDLRELIEKIERLVRPQARQQRLALEVTVPGDRAVIRAQSDWVRQAVLNLIVNAFDATPEGGRVTLEVDVKPDVIEVIISDTGSGIPDSVATRLFEMYASTKSSGSGIGLFVARTAVEACGGSLELVRTGTEGTAFRIRLPKVEGNGIAKQT